MKFDDLMKKEIQVINRDSGYCTIIVSCFYQVSDPVKKCVCTKLCYQVTELPRELTV